MAIIIMTAAKSTATPSVRVAAVNPTIERFHRESREASRGSPISPIASSF